MTVLLCAYFHIISLNVLYNLPFLPSPNMGKIGVKVETITNFFFYIMSSCTNIIAFFNNFCFTDIQPTKSQTKPCLRFSSFQIFLTISIHFWLFPLKYSFKARWFIAIKNEDKSLLRKTWTQFCTAVCWKCVCKVESWSFKAVFVLEFVKCSPNRNIFPAKPLTMKTATLNSV